jgi:hypothetical protein
MYDCKVFVGSLHGTTGFVVLLPMEEHGDEASGEFQLHATESDESL